ncbi:globin-coupled sensor protein [Asticcacaulis sp.]|uniref:globin-coupled sensor protein n=1 Tax=Asticcacaulis sp. TaxID=1872648 RepID=UPI002634BE8A|nr:globin-coupled sensor protein [Asticcacaulis sp.]
MSEATKFDARAVAIELTFFEISSGVGEVLREHKSYIMHMLPTVLDEFYDHVKKFAEIRSFFNSDDHIAHAKQKQIEHWEIITDGKFDDTYFSSVNKIGDVHNKIGLQPKWYIGGYNFLLTNLITGINETNPLPWKRDKLNAVQRQALSSAITRAVMMDMNFAIGVYIAAGESDRRDMLAKIALDFEQSVAAMSNRVMESADKISKSSDAIEEHASKAANRVRDVVGTSKNTSHSVNTIAISTEELSGAIGEIARQAADASTATNNAKLDADRTSSQIEDLSIAAQKIGDVVALINNIAAKTNLLALNATIEAARAGDAGKGFAVVASEVKQLANQTATATSTISEQVNGIQESTVAAVTAMKRISALIGGLDGIATAIAAAVEEQGAATRDITANIQKSAAGTQEVVTQIGDVANANEEVFGSAKELQSASSYLIGTSTALREEVDRFLRKVRA